MSPSGTRKGESGNGGKHGPDVKKCIRPRPDHRWCARLPPLCGSHKLLAVRPPPAIRPSPRTRPRPATPATAALSMRPSNRHNRLTCPPPYDPRPNTSTPMNTSAARLPAAAATAAGAPSCHLHTRTRRCKATSVVAAVRHVCGTGGALREAPREGHNGQRRKWQGANVMSILLVVDKQRVCGVEERGVARREAVLPRQPALHGDGVVPAVRHRHNPRTVQYAFSTDVR